MATTSGYDGGAMKLAAGDVLVARGWSWNVEPLQRRCKADYREQLAMVEEGELREEDVRPSLSVYCLPVEDSSTEEQLTGYLTEYIGSEMQNTKFVGFTTLSALDDSGFEMAPSMPPAHHWDLFIENMDNLDEFEQLKAIFDQHERRKVER